MFFGTDSNKFEVEKKSYSRIRVSYIENETAYFKLVRSFSRKTRDRFIKSENVP